MHRFLKFAPIVLLLACLPLQARATNASTGSTSSYVQANVKQGVQFFYNYGSGCASGAPGSVAPGAAPQFGSVTTAVETHVIPAGSPCAGSSLPGVAAYYDWTSLVPETG